MKFKNIFYILGMIIGLIPIGLNSIHIINFSSFPFIFAPSCIALVVVCLIGNFLID